jgi:hypothetical protein
VGAPPLLPPLLLLCLSLLPLLVAELGQVAGVQEVVAVGLGLAG